MTGQNLPDNIQFLFIKLSAFPSENLIREQCFYVDEEKYNNRQAGFCDIFH
jgi:hypothetical protein